MSIFDDALEKRFTESEEILVADVTAADTLLIKDSTTGLIKRLLYSTLQTAFGSAFASLEGGKVPASQLPSYVDDVLEYANLAEFPATGETGKIYVAIDTRKTFRWSGSAYVEISPSDVNSVAGKTGIVTLVKADVGLGSVDNTTDANKPVSTAQATAIALKADAALPANIAPVLSGSWVNYGGVWQVAGYYKDDFGLVRLTGLVKNGSGVIFVLPVGYRPMGNVYFAVTGAGASGSIYIEAATGNVNHGSGSTAYISLDGVCFRTT